MADRESRTVERMVMLDHAEIARRDAAAKLAEQEESGGARIDETEPGGIYLGADGRFHDAHGREVSKSGEPQGEVMAVPMTLTAAAAVTGGPAVTDAARAGDDGEHADALADMEKQRAKSAKAPLPEGAPAGLQAGTPTEAVTFGAQATKGRKK